MLFYLVSRALMVSLLVAVALRNPPRTAILIWMAVAAAACAVGAFAISRQPLGQATMAGRFGSAAVGWGFRAGHGRLANAIGISWFIWTLIGVAVIALVRYRGDWLHMAMIGAWAVDVFAILYLVGVMLTNRSGGSGSPQLFMILGALVLMIAVSGFIWNGATTQQSRQLAVSIAGGPPLVLGVGYGLFLLVIMTAGRGARLN